MKSANQRRFLVDSLLFRYLTQGQIALFCSWENMDRGCCVWGFRIFESEFFGLLWS
jgi:hypothetical protein